MKTAQQREELAALKAEAKKDKKSFNQLVSMTKRKGALVSVTIGNKETFFSS